MCEDCRTWCTTPWSLSRVARLKSLRSKYVRFLFVSLWSQCCTVELPAGYTNICYLYVYTIFWIILWTSQIYRSLYLTGIFKAPLMLNSFEPLSFFVGAWVCSWFAESRSLSVLRESCWTTCSCHAVKQPHLTPKDRVSSDAAYIAKSGCMQDSALTTGKTLEGGSHAKRPLPFFWRGKAVVGIQHLQ